MNQRIIYTNEAGGVSVVIPAQESGLTVEEIAARVVPEGVAFEIVDVSSIPTERTFRNAWERSGKAIAHNITKAKGLAHETRRQRRADEFAPLDVEATIPAKAAKAEAAREAIRQRYASMQAAIDAAKNVGEIKVALLL